MFNDVVSLLTKAFSSVSSLNIQSTNTNVTNVKNAQESIALAIKTLKEIDEKLQAQPNTNKQEGTGNDGDTA